MEEKIIKLERFCGTAKRVLDDLKDHVTKIIKARKSKSGKQSADMMKTQASESSKQVKNLEEIGDELSRAEKDLRDVCVEVDLSLRRGSTRKADKKDNEDAAAGSLPDKKQ